MRSLKSTAKAPAGFLITPGQDLPALVGGAGQPPLPISVFGIGLPGVAAFCRGMKIAEELCGLNVVVPFGQRVQPGDIILAVALVAGISQAVELAAGEGGKLALDLDRGLLQLFLGIEGGSAVIDDHLRPAP